MGLSLPHSRDLFHLTGRLRVQPQALKPGQGNRRELFYPIFAGLITIWVDPRLKVGLCNIRSRWWQ